MTTTNLPSVRRPRQRRGAGQTHPDPATLAGRVYLASSLPTFATDRYGRMVEHAGARFPRATILPARDLFESNAGWRRRWPRVLRSLAALAVFADAEGWIGNGVWSEVRDALRRGLPVYFLTDDGAAHPWETVAVADRNPDDWRRYACPVPMPEPHTPAWFPVLAGINPRQAAMAAAVVARAGRLDVCSVCGDVPAPVYRIDADAPLLVRLCDDCRAIQRDGFGLRATAVGRGGGSDG